MTALRDGAGPTDQNAYAAYLLGQPFRVGKTLQWELMTAREWQHAWYLRNRWRVTPNLTFTLGLRYEFFPLVTRADRPMEFLDFDSFEVVLSNNTAVRKNLWAPRIGFAYRLTDNDVIRSGYGITNNPMPFIRPLRGFYPLSVWGDFQSENPFEPFRSLAEGIPLFMGPDLSAGRVSLPPFVATRTMPSDRVNRGYIQSWNLMYERLLPAEFVVSLGYVGTQTTRQLAYQHVNWSPPGGGTSGRRLFPNSESDILYWDGWLSSNYNSFQLALNRRLVNGLFVKGAYTWGRAINLTDDDGSATVMWNDPAAFEPVSRVPGIDCTNFDCYGNSGRNILRGPSWVNLDFSLFRRFQVTEDVGFEFRAEAFNLANNPKFNNPAGNASAANFFEINSTNINAPNRVFRFGLRFDF